MNKGSERLFEALSGIDPQKIDAAAPTGKEIIHWKRWGALAAALALAVGVGGCVLLRLGGIGFGPGSAAGGSGHDNGGSVFMSYAGPVFPLTVLEGGEGLTARRDIVMDFSPWMPVWWSNEQETASRTELTEEERQAVLRQYDEWYPKGGRFLKSTDLLVTDGYTLTNLTEEDKTVRVLYPFVSSLLDLSERIPSLAADGAALNTALHAGGYSGGFQPGAGSQSEGLLNLERLNSWEGYKTLLSDGSYLDAALGEFPDLSNTPVIVYRFTGYYGPEPDEKAGRPNPTIRAGFDLDYEKTTVLSYGFHGMSRDTEKGHMIQCFSIPQPYNPWYGEPYYLFVIGEDIQNLTTGGYVTGGADADTEKLDGCGVDVKRYEMDLESALREVVELMYGADSRFEELGNGAGRPDFELYFGLMKEFLCSCGPLSPSGVERYDAGWLGEMDFANVDRVFYLEAQVHIPAGGSVKIAASMTKPASYDFHCAGTENRNIYGYDMVTRLGTNLDFTAQTAAALNTEGIEIIRQNYGFDWENGVNKVDLDQSVEHYYLEVRRVAS